MLGVIHTPTPLLPSLQGEGLWGVVHVGVLNDLRLPVERPTPHHLRLHIVWSFGPAFKVEPSGLALHLVSFGHLQLL